MSTLLTWTTVGMGEAYPDCGSITAWTVRCEKGTSEGHTNRPIDHDCHRLSCPICFDKEVWRRSLEAADRMAQVKKAYYLKGIETDYVEAIIYPPKDKASDYFGTEEGYKEMSHKILTINEDFGIIGGVKFVHTTAVNRSQGASYKEYEKYRKHDPEAKVRYNPHIQQIGLRRQDWGITKEKAAKWREAGWFIRILYADGRTENRPWNSVARKISYELSHADIGITENGNKKTFTTWFGILAYNNVHREEEEQREPEKCKCGGQCWLYWEDEKRELAYNKTIIRTYELKPDAIQRAIKRYRLIPGATRSETLAEAVV